MTADPATHRARILVAEDNPVNQTLARAFLAKLGYDADVVANGEEAIASLGRTSYSAVLLDCHMPVMDGYEAAVHIRATERTSRIPIIAMTAAAMQGERERCLRAGMDDYVAKPVELAELDATLRRWVTGSDAAAARTPPPFDADRVAALRALTAPDRPDMFVYLATIFLQQAETWVADLDRGLSQGDADTAVSAAHALRGGAATVGMVRVADLCGALEERLISSGVAGESAFAEISRALADACAWLAEAGLQKPSNGGRA